MLDAYREVARSALARRLLLLAAVSSPPRETYPVALVLFVRQATGSYAAAGAAVGASTVAAALTLPLRGWVVDRAGARAGVPVLAALRTCGLLALVLGGQLGAGAPVVVALAASIGACGAPPVPAALISRTLEGPMLRATLGLQTLLDASMAALGDLAIAPVVLLASVTAAPLLVAGLTALQGIVFLFAPSAPVVEETGPRRPQTPSRRLRALVWTAVPLGAVLGLLDVVVPAFARAHDAVAAAGPIYGALGLGVALGALVHGVPHPRMELGRRYVRQAALTALAFAPLPLAHSILAFTLLLALAGLMLGPLTNSTVLLARELAPRALATEALSWVAVGTMAGVALGGALAGPTIDALGVNAAVALVAACPAIGWVLARTRLALLRTDAPARP